MGIQTTAATILLLILGQTILSHTILLCHKTVSLWRITSVMNMALARPTPSLSIDGYLVFRIGSVDPAGTQYEFPCDFDSLGRYTFSPDGESLEYEKCFTTPSTQSTLARAPNKRLLAHRRTAQCGSREAIGLPMRLRVTPTSKTRKQDSSAALYPTALVKPSPTSLLTNQHLPASTNHHASHTSCLQRV